MTGSHLEIELQPGPVDVTLLDPLTRVPIGRWRFREGGDRLLVDFLGDAEGMVTLDGRPADSAELPDGFIAWPRMTFRVGKDDHELVTRDKEVLRRHYSRPRHQEVAYVGEEPDPYNEAFHRARIDQLHRLLRGSTGRILDAGSGYSLVVMSEPPPGLRVVACDRDAGAIRHLREKAGVVAVIATADAIPYRPGAFDVVFAGEIVEHLVDPDAALREWVGALRPGGRLILTTPNRTHLMARLLKRYIVKNPEHLFEYSRDELVEAIERAGARVVHVEGLLGALPVYIPTMGWRDLLFGVQRRWGLPGPVMRAWIRTARWFPSYAENLAVVAEKS